MAYSPLVPNANNTVGSDLTAMQENFSLLESAQVVDEGTTADGDYIRYENGWQICTIYPVTLTELNNELLRYNWTFPQSFISEVQTMPFLDSATASYSNLLRNIPNNLTGIKGTSNGGIIAWYDISVTTGATIDNCGAIAIGRWK